MKQCTVDHGALTSLYCPGCGSRVNVTPREPGEITAMLSWIHNLEVAQTGWGNPLTAMAFWIIATEMLLWCLGELSDDHIRTMLTNPRELEKRRQRGF